MYIARTNSTNTLLKELIAQGRWPADEHFIRAGYQTSGRGQAGNGWESEADKNLLCSILLPPRKNLFELNVIASVAVHRLVEKLIGAPNVNQRSVCGGERRQNGTDEPWRMRRGEGCEVSVDDVVGIRPFGIRNAAASS